MPRDLTDFEPETADLWPEVGMRLGASRSHVYKLAQTGKLPLPVIRLGRRLVVPRHALNRLLAGGGDLPAPTRVEDNNAVGSHAA